MEKNNGIFNDEKLMAFWQQQRLDALKALEVADRQIEYLSKFTVKKYLDEPEDETGWIIRGDE